MDRVLGRRSVAERHRHVPHRAASPARRLAFDRRVHYFARLQWPHGAAYSYNDRSSAGTIDCPVLGAWDDFPRQPAAAASRRCLGE